MPKIILKPNMSVICSKETLFFWTFLQIENGVFSLPKIDAFILFSTNKILISRERLSKISSLSFLGKEDIFEMAFDELNRLGYGNNSDYVKATIDDEIIKKYCL